MREHWPLDPDVTYLNHGSFGACPKVVLAEQSRIRAELEREPVQFFRRLLLGELERVRQRVAQEVGARADEFAFVRNSTAGVSAVLRSLTLQPGDALLTTDHTYGACRNALEYVTRRTGATLIVAQVPLPIADPSEVVERVLHALTPRVRLALIDHVTSQTGLIFPIETIVRELRDRGVETLVDGAHAPGMVALDVASIGAGYYVGNFHKWVCAPKGAAMLCVRQELQPAIHPCVISHGFSAEAGRRSRFADEFDWTGSDDPSPWLCVPAAFDFLHGLVPGGLQEVQRRNRELVLKARALLAEALDVQAPAPASMIGSLAALPLPPGALAGETELGDDVLQRTLFDRHHIEVPVFPWPSARERMIRVSAQQYNTLSDYEQLAAALRSELS